MTQIPALLSDASVTPVEAPAGTTAAAATAVTEVVAMRNVWKRFAGVPALRNLTIIVPQGNITVLLGPNGAGKTTAIRMITGAMTADEGTVVVFGQDPDRDGESVRRRCGVVAAKPALYDRLSGYDNLVYSAELYGLGRKCDTRIREAAARFGIEDALDRQVGGYSTGMKTRLALSRAVLHKPELLLFDEPTSGLDPESAHAVLQLIRDMTRDGSTVVMCTHHLIEAEGLADQVVMLEGGADLIAGRPADLARRYWPVDEVLIDAEDRSGLDLIAGADGVVQYGRDDGPARVQVDSLERVPGLVHALSEAGVRITRVAPHEPTLEDLYFPVRREAARA
jgi:ABC-2 type transport system ATP-binding protein